MRLKRLYPSLHIDVTIAVIVVLFVGTIANDAETDIIKEVVNSV